MTAFAAMMASLLGCANTSAGNATQTPATAGGGATTPATGGSPIPAAGSNKPGPDGTSATGTSSAGAQPNAPNSEMPMRADGSIDPVGVWWTEVETVGSEVLPILDKLDGANIRFVMRVEVSGAAPSNNVKFEFCQLQTEWIDPMNADNITTIGFRPKTVAAFTETATADLGSLSPGSKVPLPSLTFRGGTDASGNELDEDGDGNPAVTAWVKTLLDIEIEVYETITISATLDINAPDADTLTGTLDFGADAMIVSSNNVIIAAGTAVTITPDSKAVPLTVKRLPGGGDCSTVPSTIKFTTVPPPPPPLIPPEDAGS